MLENVKSFIEDLIADEVIGVNIDDATECLKIVSDADEKLKYPSKERVELACRWFNENGIDAIIDDKGRLAIIFSNKGSSEYVLVSEDEILERAHQQESEVFCAICGREVVPDEAENCPDCGTWLGEEIENKIYQNLKKTDNITVEGMVDLYDYKWDENESTSRNLRELAELMYNRKS